MPFIVFYMTLCWISTRGTKIVAWRSRHSVSFYGRRSTHSSRRGGRSRHVHSPCAFLPYKRQEHASKNASKTRATREKHASISARRLHSSGTFLPFSYGWILFKMRVLPVPLSRKSEDLAGYVFKMRMSI